MQLRRCVGTINFGNFNEDAKPEPVPYDDRQQFLHQYLQYLKTVITPENGYRAGAFASELGDTGNHHIQFYLEMSTAKRLSTLARVFKCDREVFQTVYSPSGSWAYCTGTGQHTGKPAFERWEFGEPLLWGLETQTKLRDLVQQVLDGATLREIMKNDPYAYCVHRDRLRKFYDDWNEIRHWKERTGGPIVGFGSEQD